MYARSRIQTAIGISFFLAAVAWAESTPKPSQEPNVVKPEAKEGQAKEPENKEDSKNGDTYNFYFQKSQGPNKVQQGNGSQNVEQPPTEEPVPAMLKAKAGPPVVDLLAGLMFMPGKSALGLTVGGDFLPMNKLGVKLGLFLLSGSLKREHTQSQTSIFDASDTTTRNETYGGDVAVTLNIVSEKKVKVAPMAGFFLLNDKDTTTTRTIHFWGDDNSSSTDSHFRIAPYIGLSGTVSLSSEFGLNVAVAVPAILKYTTTSLSFVWRI